MVPFLSQSRVLNIQKLSHFPLYVFSTDNNSKLMYNRVVVTCSSKYVFRTLVSDHSKESYEAVFFEVVVFLLSLFNFTILNFTVIGYSLHIYSRPLLCLYSLLHFVLACEHVTHNSNSMTQQTSISIPHLSFVLI